MQTVTKVWIGGAISAAASGAMGVLGMNVIDPQDFSFANPGKLFAAAGVCAVIGFINYLAKSPLPGVSGIKGV